MMNKAHETQVPIRFIVPALGRAATRTHNRNSQKDHSAITFFLLFIFWWLRRPEKHGSARSLRGRCAPCSAALSPAAAKRRVGGRYRCFGGFSGPSSLRSLRGCFRRRFGGSLRSPRRAGVWAWLGMESVPPLVRSRPTSCLSRSPLSPSPLHSLVQRN